MKIPSLTSPESVVYGYLSSFDILPLLTETGEPHPLAVDRIAEELNMGKTETFYALKWLAKVGAVGDGGVTELPLKTPSVDPITAACTEFCERRDLLPETFDAAKMEHALEPLVRAARMLGADVTLEVKPEHSKADVYDLAERVLDAVDNK